MIQFSIFSGVIFLRVLIDKLGDLSILHTSLLQIIFKFRMKVGINTGNKSTIKNSTFPSYCPQEKPCKKRNEKFTVEREIRDYQSISIEQKEKCIETY